MEANEQIINTFATRVRQMILQYREMRKENVLLHARLDACTKTIGELREKVDNIQHEYDTLKMAKMMQVTDGDVEAARKRVNKLIRDVNRCITLLSES